MCLLPGISFQMFFNKSQFFFLFLILAPFIFASKLLVGLNTLPEDFILKELVTPYHYTPYPLVKLSVTCKFLRKIILDYYLKLVLKHHPDLSKLSESTNRSIVLCLLSKFIFELEGKSYLRHLPERLWKDPFYINMAILAHSRPFHRSMKIANKILEWTENMDYSRNDDINLNLIKVNLVNHLIPYQLLNRRLLRVLKRFFRARNNYSLSFLIEQSRFPKDFISETSIAALKEMVTFSIAFNFWVTYALVLPYCPNILIALLLSAVIDYFLFERQ